jgi:hypothetical protein
VTTRSTWFELATASRIITPALAHWLVLGIYRDGEALGADDQVALAVAIEVCAQREGSTNFRPRCERQWHRCRRV